MDLGAYSRETSDQPPCGIDLDDAGELFLLDQLAAWDNAEVDVDWPAVRDAALAALDRSRDVRACPYLAGALLHTDGVVAFCDALTLLDTLLQSFWDEVYPKLDDGDATERSNAVFNLTNYYRIIRPLRSHPVVEDRAAGRFSLLDYEIAQGKAEPPAEYDGEPPTPALIEAAFQGAPIEQLQTRHAAITQAIEATNNTETLFREQVGNEAAPDIKRLRDTLQAMGNMLQTALAGRADAAPPDSGGDADAGQAGAAASDAVAPAFVTAPVGVIRSREDVAQHIDQILQYFRVCEPSSPVPLLLRRAKRLLYMDFMSIIHELAPNAVDNMVALGGKDSAVAKSESSADEAGGG